MKIYQEFFLKENNLGEIDYEKAAEYGAEYIPKAIEYGKGVLASSGKVGGMFVAYKLFHKLLNKCVSECSGEKGTSFGEDKLCYYNCEISAMTKQIQLLKSNINGCRKTKDPEKCFEEIKSHIIKLENKLKNNIIKRNELKIKIMRKGGNI